MDDLKLLRDLGAELEHQPPATLVRHRTGFLRGRPRRRWPTAALVAAGTAAVVAVTTAFITGFPVAAPSAGGRVDMSGAMNVLLIGSDTRDGPGNAKYGPQSRGSGQRSDTIIIVHLPADRGRATVVSVPRDSMVRVPCGSAPDRVTMINSAYDDGGATCLRSTLEKLTGLRLDHTVEVDFAGFETMVDALGGVRIKVPRPVDDRASKLRLPAGEQLLDGEKALGYARLRHYGDGSDVARIKRQQGLARAMLDKAQRQLVSDPAELRVFLSAVRGAVKTDLGVEEMYELATQLARTTMTTVSVPSEPYPQDPNRLRWKQPEAARLFGTLQ
ncbi:LCP family protein [Nonomuraea sp. NPDC049504]|uniref:LCP family protein n=1 Tax=Nonomuraea sp. NPDC049504 TaxID=3154729 RepID=UPI003424F308